MKYNFDEIIDRRNTNALNTDGFRQYIFHAGPDKKFNYADEDFVRMWVADMEFKTAPEIIDAIKERADHGIFGYTRTFNDDYYNAFCDWCRKKYDWEFPKEELMFTQGVVAAIYQLIGIMTEKKGSLLITTPSYKQFRGAAQFNGIDYVCSDLINTNGYFTIDFDDFEKKASDKNVKAVIWCNPHNPTGRMWTEDELKKVADIVKKYNLWIISDEIHCDVIRTGNKHIPMAKIMGDYDKLVTCMAPSKTFNLAGLMLSNIIIRDKALRNAMRSTDFTSGSLNPLSLVAAQAAYEKGDEWLDGLKEYLDGNFAFADKFFKENMPKANFYIPESTYLAWVDMRGYFVKGENLSEFFANNAGVLLEGGNDLFVGNAEGFVRLNFAMPRSIIEKGLNRMAEALKNK